MSEYPQYPTDPSASGGAPPARGPRPASVDTALKLIYAIIALSLIGAIITFVMLDSIVDQAIEDAGVGSTVDSDTIRSGAIIGAVIGLIISVGLYLLLAYFLGKGANWARIVYTVLAVLGILLSVVGLGGQPAVLMLLSVLQLLLTIGVLVLLWKKESSAFFTGH